MVCSVRSAVEILQQSFEKPISNLAKRKALDLHVLTKRRMFPHLHGASVGSKPETMPFLLVGFLALLPARRMTLAVHSGLAWRLAAPAAERESLHAAGAVSLHCLHRFCICPRKGAAKRSPNRRQSTTMRKLQLKRLHMM